VPPCPILSSIKAATARSNHHHFVEDMYFVMNLETWFYDHLAWSEVINTFLIKISSQLTYICFWSVHFSCFSLLSHDADPLTKRFERSIRYFSHDENDERLIITWHTDCKKEVTSQNALCFFILLWRIKLSLEASYLSIKLISDLAVAAIVLRVWAVKAVTEQITQQ
jgi:hypothetical protein